MHAGLDVHVLICVNADKMVIVGLYAAVNLELGRAPRRYFQMSSLRGGEDGKSYFNGVNNDSLSSWTYVSPGPYEMPGGVIHTKRMLIHTRDEDCTFDRDAEPAALESCDADEQNSPRTNSYGFASSGLQETASTNDSVYRTSLSGLPFGGESVKLADRDVPEKWNYRNAVIAPPVDDHRTSTAFRSSPPLPPQVFKSTRLLNVKYYYYYYYYYYYSVQYMVRQ